MKANNTATKAPITTSTPHTSGGPESIPANFRASGSKHRAAVTSTALIHDLATRQRCPRNPYSGPVAIPARIQSGL